MNKQALKYIVLAPLLNFCWKGKDFSIPGFLEIKRFSTVPDLKDYKKYLSDSDRSDLFRASQWLSFEQLSNERTSPSEKINMFLLALWIIRPTRTQVKIKFEIPNVPFSKNAIAPFTPFSRFLDRFLWIQPQVRNIITTEDLTKTAKLTLQINSVYKRNKRLRNALVLTYAGCTSKSWQVAFICFSAALEALLTYDKGRGITKRLAKSYACLIGLTKNERNKYYLEFIRLYNIRSDIMHGRVKTRNRKDVNLNDLARFSDMLRILWGKIFESEETINKLEDADSVRKDFFKDKTQGFNPSEISEENQGTGGLLASGKFPDE